MEGARRIGARHGWWQSPRPLFQRYWFQTYAGDYGFYNHMPATEAKALLNDDKIWRSYFKFAFERNPWDRQVSAYHFRYRNTKSPPSFSAYMHRKRRAWINNYEIYSIDGDPCVDFVGTFRKPRGGFSQGAEARSALTSIRSCRAPRQISGAAKNIIGTITTTRPAAIVGDWYAPEIRLLSYEF